MSRSDHIPVWGRVPVLLAVALLVTGGILGSRWLSRVVITDVQVQGARMADADHVLELAGIQEGDRLLDIRASLAADRAAREPWVARASVRRFPSGRVVIRLTEREPVALQLSRSGTPTYYLDAEGARMPFRPGQAWNVPLIHGLATPYHPMGRLSTPVITELLTALDGLDPELDALTSEWHLSPGGDLSLITVRPPTGQPITVRMGDTDIEERLRRLRSFWDQAVLPRPDARFEWVDLRFRHQIVTKETA